jgi:hypothetical protein
MKKLLLPLLLLFTGISFAQVGVNTTDPTTTLDVNGTVRIRNLSSTGMGPSSGIIGVDAMGYMSGVETGKNVVMINNVMEAHNTYAIDRSGGTHATGTIDNLAVLPSGPVTGFNMIRVKTTSPVTFLTGIEAAPDGTTIVLYPTDGQLTLLSLNIGSDPENQIMPNSNLVILQYETAQLVYDGVLEKWILM